MRMWKLTSMFEILQLYCKLTRPVLAFFLVRKRSFIKKKKVFQSKFSFKMAKPSNRAGKLFHQIHAIYFRQKNRKKTGNMEFSTRLFVGQEVFKVGHSKFLQKKQFIYKKQGHEAMSGLLMQTRYD
jgi:hypothetical protein